MCGNQRQKDFILPVMKQAQRKALLKSQQKEDLPPKKSSPPSGGPTRLGIARKSSTRKRSGVTGRSRSKSKTFSTKRS